MKLGCLFLAVCFSFNLFSDDSPPEPDSASFLQKARRPPANESWAKLPGTAVHRRGDSENRESPIYLGIRFTPERLLAQVYLDENESYMIGQAYNSSAEGTSVIANNKKGGGESILADFGLRPEDLTLSFMYWNFEKELEKSPVRSYECRVFIMQSPTQKEKAKVYINTEYCFPMKAEWIRKDDKGKDEIYRTIEIVSFKKESDFWFVDSFVIYGPGFKTKVNFSDISAGFAKDGVPADIFINKSASPQEKSAE